MNHTYLRGDMYYADLGQGIGSEQEATVPSLLFRTMSGNKHQPYGDYRFYHQQKGRKAETTYPLLHRRRKRLGIALYRSFGTTANRG